MIHRSVLVEEVIENLKLQPGMTVVDGTLGAGGHSMAILERILPGGKLISIDWDKQAVEEFEKRLKQGIFIAKRELIRPARNASRSEAGGVCPAPVNNNKNNGRTFSRFEKLGNRKGKIVGYWRGATDNYANLKNILRGLGIHSADAVFVDLGFSSDQIEDSERGFSFLKSGPLDMRYSPETQELTAADIVNSYPEKKLIEIFRSYGEEKFAGGIARSIISFRKNKKISRTEELVEVISVAVPAVYKRNRIHFATKVFQALRIETNQELENLKNFLHQSASILASEGKLAIISFHSLEDRIVKNFLRIESQDCVCPPRFPKCVCSHRRRLKIITKKPIIPSEQEMKKNPRARSAKLRVAEKI